MIAKRKRKKRRAADPSTSSSTASYVCPSCSETVDTFPDPGGGEHQTYVEDCSLCCRPNVLAVVFDSATGDWKIDASRES